MTDPRIQNHFNSAEEYARRGDLKRVAYELCAAIAVVAEQVASLAPESAPPVPVTVPDAPPAAAGMTVEEFYTELDALNRHIFDGVPRGSALEQRLRMCFPRLADLGARWRAATGLPLPTRPKGPTR